MKKERQPETAGCEVPNNRILDFVPDWMQLDGKAMMKSCRRTQPGRLKEDLDGVQDRLFLLCTHWLLQIILLKNEVTILQPGLA